MAGHLVHGQRHSFGAAGFAQIVAAEPRSLPHVNGYPASQIRKRKCHPPIASVGGSQDGEQGGILRNGQKLTIARSPSAGGEIPRKYHELAYKRFGHSSLVSSRFRNSLDRSVTLESCGTLPSANYKPQLRLERTWLGW